MNHQRIRTRQLPAWTATLALALALSASAQAAPAAKARPVPAPSPAAPVAPFDPAAPCSSAETAPLVHVPLGKSAVLKLKTPAARIILGNPAGGRAAKPAPTQGDGKSAKDKQEDKSPAATASNGVADVDVLLLNPNEIYLLGKSVGSTNLIVLGKSGVCTIMDIAVGIDTKTLESRLAQMLQGSAIKVTAAADSIVLSGQAVDTPQIQRAVAIATAYASEGDAAKVINMLSVGDPQQVMLEVKVAEINRTLGEKLGFDLQRQFTGGGGAWTKTISGIVGGGAANFNKNINATQKIGPGNFDLTGGTLNSDLTVRVPVPVGSVGSTVTVPAGATPFDISAEKVPMLLQTNTNMAAQDFTSWLIDAQKKDGLVKILAEPNIVAISGQEGSFLAGGEIMIPVPQQNGAVTLEAKQFGVSLLFTPTVLDEGRINLKVTPAVTDLIGFNPISVSGFGSTVVVPTFTTRRVSTTVQLREGQSLAIGGLLQDNFREQVQRFPILGEIPILGALFRSSEFQKNKTELLIVVTPRLVKPLPPGYILPTDGFVEPSRSEFLLEGKMEGGAANPPAEPAPQTKQGPGTGGFELK